jgi:hypothetical protein
MTSQTTPGYYEAQNRVFASTALARHANIILDDDFDSDEHYTWVCTADEAEILDWAERIAADME